MKKIFVYLLGILLAFTSCYQITEMSLDSYTTDAPQEIVFDMNTVKVTRAMVDSIEDFTEDFGVYGYIEPSVNIGDGVAGTYFMQNARYHGYNAANDSLGKGYKKYFWPKSDVNDITANFVAYYPYTTHSDTIEFDAPYLKYKIDATTVKDSVKDITDVMFAIVEDYEPKNKNLIGQLDTINPNGRIPLHFKHALSLIQFQGKKDSVIKEVTVKEIYFSGVGADSTANVKLYTNGNLSIDITDPDLPATINNGTQDSINFAKNGVLDTCYKAISTTVIIPQTAPEYVTMKFNIKLQYTDGVVEYQNRVVTRKIRGNDDNGNAYPTGIAAAWAGGYRYIYRYYVTVEEIKFDVVVDPWEKNWNQIWDTDHLEIDVF